MSILWALLLSFVVQPPPHNSVATVRKINLALFELFVSLLDLFPKFSKKQQYLSVELGCD